METLTFETPESENLFETVMKLPEKYRIVIHLYYYEEDEDGRVWVYYYDQKTEVTDLFDENGTCELTMTYGDISFKNHQKRGRKLFLYPDG